MKFYSCVLFLVFLNVNSLKLISTKRSLTPRIIGGSVANPGIFNFVAAIHVHTEDSRFFCGGALIETQWVLTAGTCVNNAVLFTIHLGSNKLSGDDSNRQTYATSTYVLHPDFNPLTLERDIGLIHLRMPVILNAYLSRIHLHPSPIGDHATTIALGFGQVSDDDPELSEDLRFVNVYTLSIEECRAIYGRQITEDMLCAVGSYNEGTCIGDTGSPLVVRPGPFNALIGVSSFISANGCESTDPSGFTRTYPYKDWINNITAQDP